MAMRDETVSLFTFVIFLLRRRALLLDNRCSTGLLFDEGPHLLAVMHGWMLVRRKEREKEEMRDERIVASIKKASEGTRRLEGRTYTCVISCSSKSLRVV